MSFPTTEIINTWFQEAHAIALNAGGSVYVMEKRAEQEVVSSVLRWAYLTVLDELEDLNYPPSSRVYVRVNELRDKLYITDGIDDTEDDEFVDDYNDEDKDEDEDENTTEKESVIDLNKCETGQKLRLRCGWIVVYHGKTGSDKYSHRVGEYSYTREGKFHDDYEQDGLDIAEILPMEDQDVDTNTTEKESVINLNKCKIGQKLRLRCGEIITYTGDIDRDVYSHDASGLLYTSKGQYYADGQESEDDIVEILPMEDQDADKESSVEIEEDLLREVTVALLKALIASK